MAVVLMSLPYPPSHACPAGSFPSHRDGSEGGFQARCRGKHRSTMRSIARVEMSRTRLEKPRRFTVSARLSFFARFSARLSISFILSEPNGKVDLL